MQFSRVAFKGLVINYGDGGGAIIQEGDQVKFYPTLKKGGGKCFSHAERGAKQVLG